MRDTMIGVDLAKSVFQLHATSMAGHVKFRKKLSRGQFFQFMSEQAPASVVMESCGSAHYWARELAKLGHEVKLIAPQYVRPLGKRQKNDAADAVAILIAARQPEMRFVPSKTADQQARAVLFRARERAVRQRTELVNALRAVLYEYGQVIPLGSSFLDRCEPPAYLDGRKDPGGPVRDSVLGSMRTLLRAKKAGGDRICSPVALRMESCEAQLNASNYDLIW